ISGIAAPAYISEIAPAKNRGKLVGLYQFNLVTGILVAFLSNYFLNGLGENDWRYMMGIEALPAIIYTFLVLTIPESPRWLYLNNQQKEAEKVIRDAYSKKDADELIAEIIQDKELNVNTESIFQKKYRFILMLAFLVAAFNQFSGINAFLYYAPRIFEAGGIGQSAALLNSVGIGLTNVIFTYIGISLIDKLGRKSLMYIGSIGYIISLTLISLSFILDWGGILLPIFLFLFIASHAIGQGAIIWVYISEIFPNHIRSYGQSFGVSTHWVLAAIIPSLIPFLFSWIGPGIVFGFFAFMMVLQLLFTHFIMPETKGVSLEDLSKKLIKN
ncbi:MAG: sugar porter family MFS transporter, partial [Cryomorphaceae bacterium]|nr:sugar porter family MFS transporter [Cryomorphaceae bacterium]